MRLNVLEREMSDKTQVIIFTSAQTSIIKSSVKEKCIPLVKMLILQGCMFPYPGPTAQGY